MNPDPRAFAAPLDTARLTVAVPCTSRLGRLAALEAASKKAATLAILDFMVAAAAGCGCEDEGVSASDLQKMERSVAMLNGLYMFAANFGEVIQSKGRLKHPSRTRCRRAE